MVKEQPRIQIVLQVDQQLCLPFAHQPVTALAIQFLILLVAFLALPGAQMHLFTVHTQGGPDCGYRQIPALLGLFRVHGFRRFEFLNQYLVTIDIHRHIELR